VSRVYLDACTIIYLVEAENPFHTLVAQRIAELDATPDSVLLTSRLSLLECRIAPLRGKDQDLLLRYDKFFEAARLEIIELTADVVEQATRLRARGGFRTPDALHLASAIAAEADVFLTGDVGLESCSEIEVEVLKPLTS